MENVKKYTLDQIQNLLANLDNCNAESDQQEMKRTKLPIPEEYGGGWATGETTEDAVRKLIERIKERVPVSKYDGPTFDECADKWILIKMGEERSPSTIETYKGILNTHLKPFFKGKKIAEISPDDIQLYFNSIMKLSKSISNQSKAVLSGIFERASRNDLISKNPMQYKYDKSKKVGKKVVLQDDDLIGVIQNLDKLKGKDYLYVCFLCFTAMRRGEILGLKWGDIDFDNEEITVQRNVSYPNGVNDFHISAPKDDSFGVVHLQSELAERIRPYKKDKNSFVLPNSDEYPELPITRSMFNKMWLRIKKTIDLKGATSHSFRASYASMMNAHCDHIDPKALQGALRHKTPDLAIKVYTKKNENKTRLAEKEYDEYLSNMLKNRELKIS